MVTEILELTKPESGEKFYPLTHVKAVVGLVDKQFFEEKTDPQDSTKKYIQLKEEYTGLSVLGWSATGGIGRGGGGGGGLVDTVWGAEKLGTIYSPSASEDLTETFSAYAIDKVWQAVLGLQQSTPNVSLVNGGTNSTLTVNGTVADFYTKAQVDNLLVGIHSFEPTPVQTLPTASSSTMFKLYLVPSSDPQTQNIKDEYITVYDGTNYSWEKIGSTDIDLSAYALKTGSWLYNFQVNSLILGGGTLTGPSPSTIGGVHRLRYTYTVGGSSIDDPATTVVKDIAYLDDMPSLANYVTLDGTQTITGAKTFYALLTAGNDIDLGGSIVPSTDIASTLGNSSRRFSDANVVNIHTRTINFFNQTNGNKDALISGGDGYLRIRTGANIETSTYKDIIFHESYGLYPENGSSVNLGSYSGSDNRYRWANIYGVNADLTGDLALSQSSHIDIGPLRIEYDATNTALYITKKDPNDTNTYGLHADGFVSAGGVGTQTGTVKYVNCASQQAYNAINYKDPSTIYTIGDPVVKIYLGTILLYSEN